MKEGGDLGDTEPVGLELVGLAFMGDNRIG